MEGGFSIGKPRMLFEQPEFGSQIPIRGWDPWLDRQGFLTAKDRELKPEPPVEMIIVQNWFEELKRLCPTGKK
jgi:hypothetical protein